MPSDSGLTGGLLPELLLPPLEGGMPGLGAMAGVPGGGSSYPLPGFGPVFLCSPGQANLPLEEG
eukprot:1159574-Pelagomonas_calceolata.AAC.7